MNADRTQIVQPVESTADSENSSVWVPALGPEVRRYLEPKPEVISKRLQEEGCRVLGRCIRPGTEAHGDATRAGLVLGYVQSGKTASFTTVTALARDNGFQLVIVIAGTSQALLDQTTRRLSEDLGLDRMDAYRRWSLLKSPSLDKPEGDTLRNLVAQHADAAADKFDLGVPLVVVMKQHVHLQNLIDLLEETPGLDSVSALVIDDEAHMHSPNVAARAGRESATYGKIKRLRQALPRHTLLQYTATPQAPLLANIADELSPEFVCLLNTGPGYTGGEYFFIEHHNDFVREIPPAELYALDADDLGNRGAPASLRLAFYCFILACAASRFRQEGEPYQSSMLVHPHSGVDVHEAWLDSIVAMRQQTLFLLNEPDDDDDRQDFMTGELDEAWQDLRQSDDRFPELTDLVPHAKTVLQRLQIQSVNAAGSRIAWPNAPYWVLVGGNLLGVGFTVEGLRTTHMMRGVGVRLADTVQQRARFFGYKAGYAKSCRTWLQGEVDAAFVDYVKHEKALRLSLRDTDRENKPLKDWKRIFLLDPRFRLTRRAAERITLDSFRFDRTGWCQQQWFVRDEMDLFVDNRTVVDRFSEDLDFVEAPEISGDTDATKHRAAWTELDNLREMLANLALSGFDGQQFTALSLILAAFSDELPAGRQLDCMIVEMGARLAEPRKRAVAWAGDEPLSIGRVTLHQGRNPRTGPVRYEGDAHARDEENVTLQIHRLDLLDGPRGSLIPGASNLPFFAVYLPERLRSRVFVES